MDSGVGGATQSIGVCAMDARRFDLLLRSISSVLPRRGVTRAIAASALVAPFTSRLALSDVEAKRKKKRKKKKSPPATCCDGARNGSESDVDCGGSCPRCIDGKDCASRDDCKSAFCVNSACQPCTVSEPCGSEDGIDCICEPLAGGGAACNSARVPVSKPTCDECPAGMNCLPTGSSFACVLPCGAP